MVFQVKWIVKIVFLCFLLMTKVLDAEKAQILFSNVHDIRLFTYGSQTYTPVLGGLNSVRSLDYDFEEKRLFFIDFLERTIIKSNFMDKDKSTRVVLDSAEDSETDWKVLAVDWVTKKLYFTDLEGNRIEVTHYDGSCRKVLVSDKLDQPNGIALFPQKGLMFVTDWGDTKKIERINMDGTERKVLVKIANGWPESVTVDYETSLVYWSDKIHNSITSMTIDGKNKTVYPVKSRPLYMTISMDQIFWSNTTSIYTILKSNQNKSVTTVTSFGNNIQPLDLKVFSSHRQPPVKSDCAVNNGGCSHLCLLRPGGIACACPTGIALKEDQKTCEDSMTNFLIFARRKSIHLISLDVDKTVAFRLDVNKKYTKNVCGVTYDVEKQRVYWADNDCIQKNSDIENPLVCNSPGSINSVFLNGTGYKQFISNDIKVPDHLVIDWVARNLYWTDAHLARIEVASLDRSSRKIIVSDNLSQPRGITIDPADGKIYWTDWGTSVIESADLNGSNRKVIVRNNIKWPNGIAIDLQARKLYWAEPSQNALFSYDLHKKSVAKISGNVDHPFGVTVLGDYLYWTDWLRKISKIRITSRESGKKPSVDILFDNIPALMGISGVDTSINYGTNPCHYKTSNCSDLCFHEPKTGAVCECPTHKELHKDEKTCYVPVGFLLYATVGSINKTSLDTYKFSHRLPFSDTSNVKSMDIDYSGGRIFWVNSDTKLSNYGIFSSFFNGSGYSAIRLVDVEAVGSIAVDWMAGNLYWNNKKTSRIEVARLDGSHHKILIYGKNVLKLDILLVNPHTRKVYWTQGENEDSIYKSLWQANLDGTQHQELLKNINPSSCDIDFKTGLIYCSNSNRTKYSIISFNPETKELKTVLKDTSILLGLKVFNGHLIYNNALENRFMRLPLNEAGDQTAKSLFTLPSSWVQDFTVYHPDAQTGLNVCSENNGGCHQLCFAMSKDEVRCGCETHYTLSSDGKTCTRPTHFLIGKQETSFLRFLYNSEHPEVTLSIPNYKGIKSIAYDEVRSSFYWLEPQAKQIFRFRKGNKHIEKIPLDDGPNAIQPYDFAIDPYSNSLFWTDEESNTINFLHLVSRANGTIFKHLDKYFPRKIVVYPEGGKLFWTSKDDKNKKSAICSSLFTGTDNNELIQLERKSEIRDIALDYTNKRLYYLDTGLNQIGSVSFQGTKQPVITLDSTLSPVSIAVHGSFILWSDNSAIYKIMKSQNADRKNKLSGDYVGLSKILAVNLTRSQLKNPCLENNGGCSHICRIEYGVSLADPALLAKCGCPIKHKLDKNTKNCSKFEECKLKQFLCSADSKCINLNEHCDGKKDCSDGEDEQNTLCYGAYIRAPCPPKRFKQCSNSIKCIEVDKWCDGYKDCPSGEDEDVKTCALADCKHVNSFRCGGVEDTIICLDNSKKCDGLLDCHDGTDEDDCPKTTPMMQTIQPGPLNRNRGSSRLVAGIVSGAIVGVVCIVFAILVYLKIRNSKINTSQIPNDKGAWPLTELRSSYSVSEDPAKSSVSTYISAVSNDLSFYDRNNVTGQSELSEMSQLIFNPPPSPVTERMSTITEMNNTTNLYSRYPDGQCDHCHRNMIGEQKFHLNEGGGRDAPPPTEVSSMMHDVDMYYPLNQTSDWTQKTICEECHSRISSSNGHINNGRLNLHDHNDMHVGNGHLHNGVVHKPIDELTDLNDDWMYDDEVDSANLDTHYGEERLFINSVGHHLFDPPPSPCTYYGEDRASSPTNTEQSSLAFGVLHSMDRHFAPPPSPTSQLL